MAGELPADGVGRVRTLINDIYPICRSITGQGVRDTLARVRERIPIEVHEVPSGTTVFDWEVPEEWNVRDAWIADAKGNRVVDFRKHNLHLVGYSVPVRGRMPLTALRAHLHSLPQHPDWIPYRTSYYRRTWGFCLPHRQLAALPEGEYEVVIDASIKPGSLTYGELLVPGKSREELLLSTHVCHPSLANDNCTGIALLAELAASLLERSRRPDLSYRLLFIPGTIGAITWLALNEQVVRRVRAGLVVGLLGDPGPLTYKRSRSGDTEMDRIAASVVRDLDPDARIEAFSPYGYDERQFCSPGFNLPMGRLTRSANEAYPEYHTSADRPDLISDAALAQSLEALNRITRRVEGNRRYLSCAIKAEPRLGKRGLFRDMGGQNPGELEHACLWLLNQSDGSHGLDDIAVASGLPREVLEAAAAALLQAGLLRETGGGDPS